jgi:two-component system response regulator YesN
MIKITRAKELLMHTELKIHEVADRVGIGSPQYFSRFFKKYTKLTPQEYRGSRPGE